MGKHGFRVLDAETQLLEPMDLWARLLPERYRSLTRLSAPGQGGPRLKPSDDGRRQRWVNVDPTEDVLRYALNYLGDENWVMSIDYPHHDSEFPDGVETFVGREGMSAASKQKILWDNVERLLSTRIPALAPGPAPVGARP